MDSKTIETIAVNTVIDKLVRNSHLEPYINTNDRESMWDGTVQILDDKKKGKASFKGRVSVQVKGSEVTKKSISKDRISFTAGCKDLKGYLIDGGVIYLVVYIEKNNPDNRKIYYKELTPLALRRILKSLNANQKTKSIDLKSLPSSDDKIATVFINFFTNCKKQSFIDEGTDLKTIEQLSDLGLVDSISASVTGYNINNDVIGTFLSNDIYLYAKIKGTDMYQPLDMIMEKMVVEHKMPVSISIAGENYYDGSEIIRSNEFTLLKIGDSLTIKQDNNKVTSIKYTPNPWLRKQGKDLRFFLALARERVLYVGTYKLDFSVPGFDFDKYDTYEARERLDNIEDAIKALDYLGVKEDFKLDEMSSEELRNLKRLSDAFVKKQKIRGLREDVPFFVPLKFGNKTILIIAKQDPKDKRTYEFSNFFDSKTDIYMWREGDEEKNVISHYAYIVKCDLNTIANLNLSNVVENFYSTNPEKPHVTEYANLMLLNFLKAYDESNNKDFLTAAKNIMEKIKLHNISGFLAEEIVQLNELQIKAREDDLSEADKKILTDITNDLSKPVMIKLGAYVLLGKEQMAIDAFGKLETNMQQEFLGFPISIFASYLKNYLRVDDAVKHEL